MREPRTGPELSVLILAPDGMRDLPRLLSGLSEILSRMTASPEIIAVVGDREGTFRETRRHEGATLVLGEAPGYGAAVRRGFLEARGRYIVTFDGDFSYDPDQIESLWGARDKADVVVASRFTERGRNRGGWFRRSLSRIFNAWLRFLLDVHLTDFTSGLRLFRAEVVKDLVIEGDDFAALVELIVKSYAGGWRIVEVPFHCTARRYGQGLAQALRIGLTYLRTTRKMWLLRNSISCADYDARAYDSRIPPQRLWQRQRYKIITTMADGSGRILDIGCGSSRILDGLRESAVGLDFQFSKLRYARRYRTPLVNGDVFGLPFASECFECIIISEVIEHLAPGLRPFEEMMRLLRPGGCLIVGTPDYGRLSWRVIERVYSMVVPGGYAEEHVRHYTRDSLIALLRCYGLEIRAITYIYGSELIIRAVKPLPRAPED